MANASDNRRPIASRSTSWARNAARLLARTSITPNQISLISILFAVAGAAALLMWPGWIGLASCAIGVQLRLVCNLLDGMVAVEYGKGSPLGAMYNEFPDRIADSILIVALGYAAGIPWLGWLGALLAALTAYIRIFGATLGQAQDFRGPMSKSHRMAVMTVGCLIAAVEPHFGSGRYALPAAAMLIAVGAALTCANRCLAIARRRLAEPQA